MTTLSDAAASMPRKKPGCRKMDIRVAVGMLKDGYTASDIAGKMGYNYRSLEKVIEKCKKLLPPIKAGENDFNAFIENRISRERFLQFRIHQTYTNAEIQAMSSEVRERLNMNSFNREQALAGANQDKPPLVVIIQGTGASIQVNDPGKKAEAIEICHDKNVSGN